MSVSQFRQALSPLAGNFPPLTPAQEGALADHIELLLRWNARMNLTAVRKFDDAVRKHVGESLFLASHVTAGPQSACDLGSGGGFPGIPLAVVRPEWRITLVERDVRKGVFLREASRGLPNVNVVTKPFEEIPGSFDWLTSRAVNLALTRSGSVAQHAAVLGGQSLGEDQGLVARYEWQKVAVPWENGGLLWLGELRSEASVSRET